MEQGDNWKGRGQTGSFCKPMIELKGSDSAIIDIEKPSIRRPVR